jgi:branched-chain amino acid transport system permease protein
MVTTLWSGLAVGAVYALTALGYNVVFVTAGVFNFAQAQFVMIGTFLAFASTAQLHLPVGAGFLFGAAVGFVLGALEERAAMRPIAGKGAHGELVTTVGAAIALDGIAEVIWGSQPLSVKFFGSTRSLVVAGGRILPDQVLTIAVAVALTGLLMAWSRWTLTGNACLAASEDRTAAMLRGVNIRRFTLLAVASAAALAGLLGPLIGPETYAVYNLGDSLVAYAFVAIILGGAGSYGGSLLGGFAAGIIEAFALYYWGSNAGDLVLFAVLLIVLGIRPGGVFGARRVRLA